MYHSWSTSNLESTYKKPLFVNVAIVSLPLPFCRGGLNFLLGRGLSHKGGWYFPGGLEDFPLKNLNQWPNISFCEIKAIRYFLFTHQQIFLQIHSFLSIFEIAVLQKLPICTWFQIPCLLLTLSMTDWSVWSKFS